MATKKKPAAKATKNTKASGSAKKAAPKKSVANKGAKKAPAKPAKKATSVKKAIVKPNKKAPQKGPAKKIATPVKKTAIKKAVKPAAKAASEKKAVVAKKAASAKKLPAKSNKPVNKKISKSVSAKPATAKKVVPAKKAAAPVKPAAKKVVKPEVTTKKSVSIKKAAPVPVKKEVASPKVEPAKKPVLPSKAAETKKSGKPAAKKIIVAPTTKANAKPVAPAVPSPAARPAITRSAIREEKKANVIIAHRRLENKSKQADESKTMINYQPEFTRSILDQPTENQGPVYRYSDEELNEFKELILNRMEAAKKELAYLQGLITRKDEAGTEDTENRYMNMEDGSGAMEREQLAQLASRQIQFINHLEKALMRIENKTYGICRVTGKLIDKARLRAVPHATLSIEAKKTMSK